MKKVIIPEEVINCYKETSNLSHCAKKYNIHFSTLRKKLKDLNLYNIDLTKQKRYDIDLNFFKKIDTEEKAYFLGLLYADGYTNEKSILGIDLKKTDSYILERFNKIIKSNKPLKYYNAKNRQNSEPICRLVFTKKEIVKDLNNLGILKNKTNNIYFPTEEQVPSHLIHHFIRGYFDGDGCITKNSRTYSVEYVGIRTFLDKIEEIINNYSFHPIKGSFRKPKCSNSNIQEIIYFSNIKTLIWFKFLYTDATIFIERKYKKFVECIEKVKNCNYELHQFKETKHIFKQILLDAEKIKENKFLL